MGRLLRRLGTARVWRCCSARPRRRHGGGGGHRRAVLAAGHGEGRAPGDGALLGADGAVRRSARRRRSRSAIDCAETGTARWVDSRTWAYDFGRDLPAGVRCAFSAARRTCAASPASRSAARARFDFSTGGPAIESSLPGEGSDRIEEEQAFVLEPQRRGGARLGARPRRLRGRGHRRARRRRADRRRGARRSSSPSCPYWLRAGRARPSCCRRARPSPTQAKVRLIWGAGIASPSGVVTEQDQVLEFRVRAAVHRQAVAASARTPRPTASRSRRSRCASPRPVAWELAKQVRPGGSERRRATRRSRRRAGRVRHQHRVRRRRSRESATFHLVLPARPARRRRPAARQRATRRR